MAFIRSPFRRQLWFYVLVAALLAAWLFRVAALLQDSGLFRVIGVDWSQYYAQALILRSGDPASIYDLARSDTYLQTLRIFTTDPSQPLAVGPVAYPPIFAWLMIPFTLPPAPVGFGLWTLVNLAAVGYLARRVADVLPGVSPLRAALALLVSFAVAQGLIVGQPTALLACAIAEWYLALRLGRDFRAGMWLSVLLLKPQYGILIGPVLIWKRRWNAVAGVTLGGLVIMGASALVVGLPALWTYGSAVADILPWGGAAVASPGQMINWRGLILNLRPSIGPSTGVLLTLVLGLVSVAATLVVWRGAWSAASWSFPFRIAATLLTTVLANYHSHVHGLTLAAVPVAASLGERSLGRVSRWALLALTFAPTIVIILVQHLLVRAVIQRQPVDVLIWSPLVQVLLVVSAGGLVFDVLSQQSAPVERLVSEGARHRTAPAPPTSV